MAANTNVEQVNLYLRLRPLVTAVCVLASAADLFCIHLTAYIYPVASVHSVRTLWFIRARFIGSCLLYIAIGGEGAGGTVRGGR